MSSFTKTQDLPPMMSDKVLRTTAVPNMHPNSGALPVSLWGRLGTSGHTDPVVKSLFQRRK